jgi:quinohemoprotein amine dehydrogenase
LWYNLTYNAMRRNGVAFGPMILLWLLALAVPAGQQPPAPVTPEPPPDTGIPIPSKLVQSACGPCHRTDEKQQISRISFQRHTPEGWQDTIRRMVALNGLKIEPAAAREVVKYLSNNLGLAPEEARPALYEVERRLVDEQYTASTDLNGVCNACHSLGRVISQRRTRSEWDLLIAMHRGWYPLIDRQGFRRMGPAPRDRGPDGRPPDTRHPVEKAIDHLSRTFPLETPEWAAWSASMRPARIEGTWALTGHEIGKGPLYGRAVLTPVPNTQDEFTSEITYTYARSGEQVKRTGRALIYTGFQWRGRSTVGGDDKTALREVMSVERDWRRIQGRWFTGGYDELGLDVRLDRVGRETLILGADRVGLRTGLAGQSVKIHVANAPGTLQARDLDLGPGVTVTQASVAGDVIAATVDVAATAAVGPRDIVVAGAVRPAAFTVYDRIDAIHVTPEWSMARVGGVNYPKMLAQFEAWAYHNGPDKKPGTADDLKIDLVDALWTVEEYTATLNDDDVKFVGEIEPSTGRFHPNVEGPNPKRSGERNNVGDVWVVASFTPPGSPASAAPLRGRAHLLVTVPLYMRFDARATP